MANHVSHAALPYPVKGCRFTIQVPYLDADGDPTDPTTPDTERSIDGASYADCSEEVTTITGSNGSGYLTLTGDEMNASMVMVAAKVASGPKPTLATLYPRVLAVLFSGTATAGAAGSITLSATNPPPVDDMLIGCIIRTTGGTGGGGGSGSLGNQARVITDYVASTRVVSVAPNWETNPANGTTYEILMTAECLFRYSDDRMLLGSAYATPTVAGVPEVDLTHILGTAAATPTVAGVLEVDVTHLGGAAQSATDLKDFADSGYDPDTNKVEGVKTVDTVTAVTGLTASDVGAIKTKTDQMVFTVANRVDATSTLVNVQGIKKNTAYANVEFVMYDSAGAPTGGLTVTSERSIDGAAFGSCANSAAEVANGVYKISLDAADLNGNCITFRFTAAGAVPTLITVFTVQA